MKANIEWSDKPIPGVKRKIRITFIKSNSIKWQFKRSDEDKWDYITPPSRNDWEDLQEKAYALYQRKRLSYEYLKRIQNLMENL